jgi:hypothetical protein
MILAKCISLLASGFLMCCGPVAQEGTHGGFITPARDGTIDGNLVETQSAVIANTVSLVAGRHEGSGLRAYAGIVPDQPVQAPLLGEGTFRGPYVIAFIDRIVVEDNFVSGLSTKREGTITLTTNLTEMTLFGTDEVLTVRAHVSDNQTLSGEVEFEGVPGVLQGEIGEDRAFGVFHGGDLTHLMSGGFVTSRQP